MVPLSTDMIPIKTEPLQMPEVYNFDDQEREKAQEQFHKKF
jgi:hypothetical protein